MASGRVITLAGYVLAIAAIAHGSGAQMLPAPDESSPASSQIEALGLPAAEALQLRHSMDARDYVAAEKILLPEIAHAGHSAYAGRLLSFAGGVYFLDGDAQNAAIAWNKAQAIAPLPAQLRFSLAMAYIRMGHSDWATRELQQLAAENAREALYAYWLGRVDYDAHRYDAAILHFNTAIKLDPRMARAYDNLGLCYFYENRNELAVANYRKAIALDGESPHRSAWPYANLAAALLLLNHADEAETNLREALSLDPTIASVHFQLGNLLENSQRTPAAILEFRKAIDLDANYAEPHIALARIYRRQGNAALARQEVQAYMRIHEHTKVNAATHAEPLH